MLLQRRTVHTIGFVSVNAKNCSHSLPSQLAAKKLHQDARQWEEKDNNMVATAKKMAELMLQMSVFAKYVSF